MSTAEAALPPISPPHLASIAASLDVVFRMNDSPARPAGPTAPLPGPGQAPGPNLGAGRDSGANSGMDLGLDLGLGPAPGPWGLFTGYAKAASMGFGGANAWCRRVIVEERRWMSERDYAEVMGVGQVLPGPNVGNGAVMIGRRFAGLPGSVAACAGLYAPPLIMLMGFAYAWDRLGAIPAVAGFMHGVAAAAAGMVIGNALRQASRLHLPWELIGIVLAAAAAAAWFRLPLLLIVALLGPAGIAAVVVRGRRA